MVEGNLDTTNVLLGIMAAGLISYGFYQIVHARYLQMRPLARL